MKKKIAIISDIHGNSWALRAVLDDIQDRGIEDIINLGDSLYGPLDPRGTFNLLDKNKIISIAGNQDRNILENLNSTSEVSTMEYVKSQIDNDAVTWLKKLPFQLIHKSDIYCCHASPENDSAYLLENLQADHIAIKSDEEIDEILKNIEQKIILCAHSHVPRTVKTSKKTIINPGSVGLPAYDDNLPIPHKMENFSPGAKYSIITFSRSSINISQVSISYNYEAAAEMAEKNKRVDWAKWIRLGRA